MKDIDWNIIFKLNEFVDFLGNKNLIELSMSSKKIRKNLDKEISKSLNFHSFANSENYKSVVIDEYEEIIYRPIYSPISNISDSESSNTSHDYITTKKTRYCLINPYKPDDDEFIQSIEKLKSDLNPVQRNLNQLLILDSRDYSYMLCKIPLMFNNLETLIIVESALKIEALISLLNNFNQLKNFELAYNIIFQNLENPNEYDFNWPDSLKNLKIVGNEVKQVQSSFNHIDIKKINYWYWGTMNFNVASKHLPNLLSFEYGILNYLPDDERALFRFIKLNPQIKSLKIQNGIINLKLLDIIKSYDKLTHFEFNRGYESEDLEDYEIPVLYSIKHLHVKISYSNIEEAAFNFFPNVTELVIEFYLFECYEKYNVIKNFENLKRLKIVINMRPKNTDKLTIPKLECLEKLEINLNYEYGKFKHVKLDINACDGLKLVTFTKKENYNPFVKPEQSVNIADHYNFIYFPYKLQFHKISQ